MACSHAWIEGKVKMDAVMASYHAWEQAMIDLHPCWGQRGSCISCGCSETGPCGSHKGSLRPAFDHERMAAARVREAELRAAMWPR